MELKFKEFNSYKHLTEKDLKSDYYKPEYGFDLSLLPLDRKEKRKWKN